MSEVMITGEGNFEVVRAGAVETKPGLGFVPQAVVDQHFIARQRLNRLLSVILEQPMLLGVDFLRTHRVLVAHSQRRIYLTYVGGTVFETNDVLPASSAWVVGSLHGLH